MPTLFDTPNRDFQQAIQWVNPKDHPVVVCACEL